MSALLTITIPTFNRAEHLDVLLESLFTQTDKFRDEIRVVVIDNHSTDDTALRCEAWKQKGVLFDYICNATNIGMANNIVKCFEIAETEFSWTIGDDDRLSEGMLACVMEILKRDRPDLLHFGAQLFAQFLKQPNAQTQLIITPKLLDSYAFARLVNVYVTFLSCLVIRKTTYANLRETLPIEKYSACVIPQLSWIFEILNGGNRFVYVPQRLILSRDSGTDGYDVCETFSTQIVEILNATLPKKLADAFQVRIVIKYIPAAIFKLRCSTHSGIGISKSNVGRLRHAYSRFVGYWLFVVPVIHLPFPFARVFYYISRLASKGIGALDRLEIYYLRRQR